METSTPNLKIKNMIFLLTPFLAAALPGLISAAGNFITRQQSRGDINRQNAYNHPARQIARLREAGLPYGALTNNSAGNQSALPQTTDGGLGKIAEHATTRMQLKQLEILEAERRSKEASADKDEAMTAWLLSHTGEDSQNTNLTQGLKQGITQQQVTIDSGRVANKLAQISLEYAEPKAQLDLSKATVEISNALKQGGLIDEHTKGSNLDNKIKAVVASYQKGMSEQQFIKLMKDNDLISENIEIAKSDKRIRNIQANIEENTEGSKTMKIGAEAALSSLTWERVKAEFDNYQQYQAFVQKAQDLISTNPWKGGVGQSFKSYWEGIMALAYTTITGKDGQSGNTLQLLNHIK